MATYILKSVRECNGVFEIPESARIIGYNDVPPSGMYDPSNPDTFEYHREILYLYKVVKVT